MSKSPENFNPSKTENKLESEGVKHRLWIKGNTPSGGDFSYDHGFYDSEEEAKKAGEEIIEKEYKNSGEVFEMLDYDIEQATNDEYQKWLKDEKVRTKYGYLSVGDKNKNTEYREKLQEILVTFPASYCFEKDALNGWYRFKADELLALAKGENKYNQKGVMVGADWPEEYQSVSDSSVSIEDFIEISQKVLEKLGIDWNSATQNEIEEALKKVPDGKLTIEE